MLLAFLRSADATTGNTDGSPSKPISVHTAMEARPENCLAWCLGRPACLNGHRSCILEASATTWFANPSGVCRSVQGWSGHPCRRDCAGGTVHGRKRPLAFATRSRRVDQGAAMKLGARALRLLPGVCNGGVSRLPSGVALTREER